jgi:hypothetical protein
MRALLPGKRTDDLPNEMDRLFDRIWEGELPERAMPRITIEETSRPPVYQKEEP